MRSRPIARSTIASRAGSRSSCSRERQVTPHRAGTRLSHRLSHSSHNNRGRNRPQGRLFPTMTVVQRLRSMRKTMRDMFGIVRLRAGQEDIIRSVLQHKDTLATMPTGAGKSLCYQLPALHLEGTTLVVSPLIALMKDQADKLAELDVRARAINSTLNTREEQQALAG